MQVSMHEWHTWICKSHPIFNIYFTPALYCVFYDQGSFINAIQLLFELWKPIEKWNKRRRADGGRSISLISNGAEFWGFGYLYLKAHDFPNNEPWVRDLNRHRCRQCQNSTGLGMGFGETSPVRHYMEEWQTMSS